LSKRREKEKKNFVGSETTPYINEGKGDTLAQGAVSLLPQGKGRSTEDLKDDRLQTKTLRATGYFKRVASCCQFVRMEH